MSTPFTDYAFSKSEIKILKSIKRNGKILKTEVDKFKNDKYNFLLYYSLLDHYKPDYKYYCLNNKAKMYLTYHREEKIKFFVPLIISVAALIISIVSIAMPEVIIIQKWLKL